MPGIQAIGSWAKYLGFGTQAEAGRAILIQAIGNWAMYLGLGTQAEAGDGKSWNTGYWQLG